MFVANLTLHFCLIFLALFGLHLLAVDLLLHVRSNVTATILNDLHHVELILVHLGKVIGLQPLTLLLLDMLHNGLLSLLFFDKCQLLCIFYIINVFVVAALFLPQSFLFLLILASYVFNVFFG